MKNWTKTALAAGAFALTKKQLKRCAPSGERIGMAFQIKDDLFDYGEDEIGKPVGIDIKAKKMTLPLIYALSKASWSEKRGIIPSVKNESEKPKKVREVIEFVKKSGGIEYALAVMNRFYADGDGVASNFPGFAIPDFTRAAREVYDRKE